MKRALKILLRTLVVLFVLLNVIVAFHAYKFTHFYDAGEVTIKNKKVNPVGTRPKKYCLALML